MTTIVTRSGKGSPLTNTEMDANLNNLNNDKQEVATAVQKTGATKSAILPSGITSERDAVPTDGYLRYNTELDQFEGYVNGAWSALSGFVTLTGTETLTNKTLTSPKITNQQVSDFATASENHFIDGSTANVLIIKRGTSASPGADLIKFDAGVAAITGTSTNNSASAGIVGEYKEAIVPYASRGSLTSNVAANTVTLSLPAGDWDVTGIANFDVTTGPSQYIACSIGTTSATFAGDDKSTFISGAMTVGYQSGVTAPTVRLSLAATTTVYLVAKSAFTGNMSFWGMLRARRVR